MKRPHLLFNFFIGMLFLSAFYQPVFAQTEENRSAPGDTVVIGYGVQLRENITGSMDGMDGETMRNIPSTNFAQALQGRIAGVQMTQTNSKPGAEMQIRIRGTRSLETYISNEPLIILDGIAFAGSLNNIDPNAIKSIDILKDASATAIYGSRGANGVILVTTNHGTKGQKFRVTYDGYFGAKTLFSRYPMMDGPQLTKLRSEAARTAPETGGPPPYGTHYDESDGVNTDWQDLMYKTAITTSHNIGVTGGTAKGSYNIGAGYMRDESLLPRQNFSRISIHAGLDQQIGRYFRVGLSTNNSFNKTNGQGLNMYNSLAMSPLLNPWDESGNWKRGVKSTLESYWSYSRAAIEALGRNWDDNQSDKASYNTVFGEVKIPWIEGLTYRMTLGLNAHKQNYNTFMGTGVFSYDPNSLAHVTRNKSYRTDKAIENLITYEKSFSNVHHFTLNGLYSVEKTDYKSSYKKISDLPTDQIIEWDASKPPEDPSMGKSEGEMQLNSWMGRLMYSYDNRYLLSAIIRYDGSSRFSPENKWSTYPAVSAGWNLKKESFMDDIAWIDLLKLRIGYGKTSGTFFYSYSSPGRLSTTRPHIPDYEYKYDYDPIRPECSETWNYGLDFSLFNSRLNGSVEYYSQTTKDVLLNTALPGSGYTHVNMGKTSNKGFELSLDGILLENLNGWTWRAGFNLYTNKNEIVKLAPGQESQEGNLWFVGHPVNVVYDYEKIGLWQENDLFLKDYEPMGNVGMIKVKYTGKYNADGSPVRPIGYEDRQIIHLDPKIQGGFNTTVAYKDFDLTVIGDFQNGGKLISTLYGASSYLNLLNYWRGNMDVDYWTPENTGAKYPRPGGIRSYDSPKYANTMTVFDATYLKIRAITLGYSFDQNWLKSAGIQRLRLYVTAQNPFVLFSPYHNETGMDPETNSYGSENQQTGNSSISSSLPVISANAPATRNYLFGINLTF
jgi:TonB-linked outer membrane protein, SusC/RagA family